MTGRHPLRLHWLDPRNPSQPFPDPALALREPDGLLAVGGDLSTTRLLSAYSSGIFPWFNPDEPILWWSPDPRCVFVPGSARASDSLAKRMRQQRYAVSFDAAFETVIAACGGPRRGARGTWLSPDMRASYIALHHLGHAHSVEVWMDGQLAGGLYGVAIGGVFFGESMFSVQADASKLALQHLSAQLADWSFALIDCQVVSPHLLSLGAQVLPRSEFLQQLKTALQLPAPKAWKFTPQHQGNPAHFGA